MGIYGKEPNLEIYGMLMWRGTEVHPDMKAHPSFEYYDAKKMDLGNQEDKDLVIEYWTKLEDTQQLNELQCTDVKVWK